MSREDDKLHVFHVMDANEYWIGASAEDVQAQRVAMFGADSVYDDDDVRELRDDHVLGFRDEDEPESTRETHTCAEWIANNGSGLLAACEP